MFASDDVRQGGAVIRGSAETGAGFVAVSSASDEPSSQRDELLIEGARLQRATEALAAAAADADAAAAAADADAAIAAADADDAATGAADVPDRLRALATQHNELPRRRDDLADG